jgi:broad specificity phosphatase PhoE
VSLLMLIRHGPTLWNEHGRIQGRSDTELSPGGRAAVAAWVLPPAATGATWMASPLRRAQETAEILLGRPAAAEARLIETDWGAWEGERLVALRERLGTEMAANEARGLDFRPPGGESPRDVQQRLRPLLAELADRAGTVVAVTHKGVIRAVYALASGWNMQDKPPTRLRNGCAQAFTLGPGGQPAVERLNIPLNSCDHAAVAAP